MKDKTPLIQMRIDKWLWTVRFFKTRKIASEAVKAGKILLNGQRIKPAKQIQLGANVTINKESLIWQIRIEKLIKNRRPAAEARLCYSESEDSIQTRLAQLEKIKQQRLQMPETSHRPNKKERRHIHRFKQSI